MYHSVLVELFKDSYDVSPHIWSQLESLIFEHPCPSQELAILLLDAFEEIITLYISEDVESSVTLLGGYQCEANDNAGIVNSLEEPLRMG